jgi:hypothetical protein
MARKKRVAKRTTRTKKKVVARKSQSKSIIIGNIKKNISLILNNLLLFIALALVSFVLYRFLTNDLLKNLFQVMSMVFGFVSVAFLISLLVLVIIKFASKKK